MLDRTYSIFFKPDRRATRWGIVVSVAVLCSLLQLVLLTVSPDAHASVHPDSDHPDHVCAVTLAAAGFCDTTPEGRVLSMPLPEVGTRVLFPTGGLWSAPDHWLPLAHAPPDRR